MMESNRCQRCGNPLPKDGVLAGACPRCMLELGYETKSEIADRKAAGRQPESIGRYRILRVIGEGGMGIVYEAEQEHPRRTVALKIVRHGISSPELVRRFEQESSALGRLQHPGIAQIYEAGTVDTGFGPQPYFAMELIRGLPPREFAELHHLDTRQRIEIMVRICDAVHHAHQRGLIHRDLKPANILVDDAGQPKILDFGVVRVTDSDTRSTIETDIGQLIGTLAYMSPEQALADPLELDTRTDVYALGIVLYELLTGKLPYTVSGKIHEAIQAIRDEDPARISSVDRAYRGDIETIVGKALEKDKTRRYESASGMAADLQHYLRSEPIAARAPSMTYQLRMLVRRKKSLVALVAGVLVLWILLTGYTISMSQTYQYLRAVADAERDIAVDARKLAAKERDLARSAEQQGLIALDRAVAAEKQAQQNLADITSQRLLALWQSLARESIRGTADREDDRTALLAVQAMRFNLRTPNQARILVEDALQQAMRMSPWTHDLLDGFETEVFCVAYSADGKRIAAGGLDGLVRIWNLQRPGEPPVIISGHQGPVLTVAFSPDSEMVASGGGTDNRIKIWSLHNPDAPKAEFQFSSSPPRTPAAQGKVSSISFSANGQYLAAAGEDTNPRTSYVLRVWDLHNPQIQPVLIYRDATVQTGSREPTSAVAFSHQGLRLASEGSDRVLRVWDLSKSVATPELLQEFGLPSSPPPEVGSPNVGGFSVAFSPDDMLLASAAAGTRIWLWDLSKPGGAPQRFQDNAITRSVSFSSDGLHLASGGYAKVVRIWDVKKPGTFQELRPHLSKVNFVAFSPDGTQVASGSSDKTLRISDISRVNSSTTTVSATVSAPERGLTVLNTGDTTSPPVIMNPGPAGAGGFFPLSPVFYYSGAFSTGTARLAALGLTRTILVWNLSNPRVSPIQIQTTDVVEAIAISPDGVYLAAGGTDQNVRIWDLRNPAAPSILVKVYADMIRSLAFSPDGFRLAAGASSLSARPNSGVDVRVWDLRYPTNPPMLLHGPDANLTSLTFSHDGSKVAASDGSANNRLLVWDLRRNDTSPALLLWSAEAVTSVAFSPDGKRLAGGSADGTIRVFELRDSKRPPILLQGAPGSVHAIAFSPNGEQLAFASDPGGTMLFDLITPGTPPILFDRNMNLSVAFLSDGNHLAAGFANGGNARVMVWPVWSSAADYLCARVWRNLAMDEWRLYVGEGIPYERTCSNLPPGAGAPGAPK